MIKNGGVAITDDQSLFEYLTLEGAQAGLSWLTILKKRDHYRQAFDQFDIEKVARYSDKKIAQLLLDSGVVRNRSKILSVRNNAQAVIKIQQQLGSFSHYLWQFIDGKTIHNHYQIITDIPTETALSKTISQDLKKRGFTFVGPTIMYAFMQATGMVNDHTVDCFRYLQCKKPT